MVLELERAGRGPLFVSDASKNVPSAPTLAGSTSKFLT